MRPGPCLPSTLGEWKGKADRGLGGFQGGGEALCRAALRRLRRDSGTASGINWGPTLADRRAGHEGTSRKAMEGVLRGRPGRAGAGGHGTDSSALGSGCARALGCEQDFAIAGQDCIPRRLEEMSRGRAR